MFDSVIFREYDIRGIYGRQFDRDFAKSLGAAIVEYIQTFEKKKHPLLVVGYDARLSGPEIKTALSEGIRSAGGGVIFVGLVTTPMTYFATFAIPDVSGAVMITGSHNPPDYNGFKISVGKQTIFGDQIQELRRIILKQEDQKGSSPRFLLGKEKVSLEPEKNLDLKPLYIERYAKEFGTLNNKMKIVLDSGNGSGGVVLRELFARVGLNPTILFEEPDGRFPNHHPDPTVEKNLKDLALQVKTEGAIVGIGFDGDSDRIGLVDHRGQMVYGDELMVIISRHLLSQTKGAKIIGDVKCSDRLFEDIRVHGGVPIMWKTGHSLIKEKIKTEKAPFGGEMSGHVFFADRNYGFDDAIYAALRVCEIISQTGKTIPELLDGLPSSFNTPEIRIDTTEEKKTLIVKKLIEAFPGGTSGDEYSVDLTDGVRVSFPYGWGLARASNTQPVLVLRFESNTEAGLKEIRHRFEKVFLPLL